MNELYQLLGIDRAATDRQIKDAYRRASKLAHPDTGGDAEAFARLKLARDVLLDPERRRHYDATGEARPTVPDNHHAQCVGCLSQLLDMALQATLASGQVPINLDIVDIMRQAGQAEIAKQHQARGNLEKQLRTVRSLKGRFHRKKAGDNLFESMLGQRETMLAAQLQGSEANIRVLTAALVLLADYAFQHDLIQQVAWGLSSGMTTTMPVL